mgnify:CR=1 FL=1
MLRVVYDTNTILSGLFWSGAPTRALDAAVEKQVQLLTTESLLDELADVLSRPKFVQRLDNIGKSVEQLMAEHRAIVELIMPAVLPAQISADPDDDAVIACAVGGQADYMVSGDKHLLTLGQYADIPIWDVNRFMHFLEEQA